MVLSSLPPFFLPNARLRKHMVANASSMQFLLANARHYYENCRTILRTVSKISLRSVSHFTELSNWSMTFFNDGWPGTAYSNMSHRSGPRFTGNVDGLDGHFIALVLVYHVYVFHRMNVPLVIPRRHSRLCNLSHYNQKEITVNTPNEYQASPRRIYLRPC